MFFSKALPVSGEFFKTSNLGKVSRSFITFRKEHYKGRDVKNKLRENKKLELFGMYNNRRKGLEFKLSKKNLSDKSWLTSRVMSIKKWLKFQTHEPTLAALNGLNILALRHFSQQSYFQQPIPTALTSRCKLGDLRT